MLKHIFTATAIGAILLTTGCASPARVQGMTAGDMGTVAATSLLYDAVSVDAVNGGETTNPMWTSEVGGKNFREALRSSLNATGLLAHGDASYLMQADILDVDQPMFGLTFTVQMRVRYWVTGADAKIIYQHECRSTGTATFSDAFSGIARLRIANERAARANIEALIADLLQRFPGKVAVTTRH